MKKLLTLCAVLTLSAPAYAEMMHHEDHSGHHAMHQESVQTENLTEAHGTLHNIDVEKRSVNLTHAPIPSLKWPEMTMDLPVSENVDLSQFGENEDVRFFLKLENKAYVIDKMDAASESKTDDAHGDHAH